MVSEMEPELKPVTVKLPVELLEKVKDLRKKEGRTMQAFFARALQSAVDFSEKYSPSPAGQQGRRR